MLNIDEHIFVSRAYSLIRKYAGAYWNFVSLTKFQNAPVYLYSDMISVITIRLNYLRSGIIADNRAYRGIAWSTWKNNHKKKKKKNFGTLLES